MTTQRADGDGLPQLGDYLVVCAMLYVSASAVLFDHYVLKMAVYVVVTCMYLLFRPLIGLRRELEAAAVLFLLVGLVVLVPLVNSDPDLTPYLTICVTLVLSFLLSRVLSLSAFAVVFVRVMLVLASASLVLFAVGLLFPAVVNALPHVEGQYLDYRDAGLHVYLVSNSPGGAGEILGRNSGFTWEPGAYSVLLNLALVLHLDQAVTTFSRRWRHLPTLVFVVAVITTLSPAGVLCTAATLIVYRRTLVRKDWKVGGGTVALLMVVAYASYELADILARAVSLRSLAYLGTNDRAVLERLSISRLDSLDLTPWFPLGASFTTFEETGLPIWNSILHAAIALGYPFTVILLLMNINLIAKFRPHALAMGLTLLLGYSVENYFWKPIFCFLLFAAFVQVHQRPSRGREARTTQSRDESLHV